MPINVDAVFPVSGAMDLAPDALFQIRLSCEPLWEDPLFVVEQNGVEVEADVRIHRRMVTADSEEVFVEVDPVEDLKPGSSFWFSVDYFGMRTAAATFVVGEVWAMPEILEVPNIYWMSTYDVSDEEPEGECWIQKEGQIDFDLDIARRSSRRFWITKLIQPNDLKSCLPKCSRHHFIPLWIWSHGMI